MAEDDPRHGEAPEHGQDPGTTDQPIEPSAAPEPPTTVGPPPSVEPPTTPVPSEQPEADVAAEPSAAPEPAPPGEPEPSAEAEPAPEPEPGREPTPEPEPQPQPRPQPEGGGVAETAETQRIPRPDDATAIHPTDPWAETASPIEPPDEGPRPVGPSGTTVMPAVPPPPPPPGSGPTAPAGTPRWTARAQVPQAESHDTMAEGLYEEPTGRGLGTTLIIGGCVVLLLAAIAFGVWLVVRGLMGVTPTPPVEPTQPTATAPPTTAPTKPSPTPTTPVAVPVPDLRGQDYNAAATTLTGLGLVPKRVNEPSTTVAAGKVIRTDPSGGFVLSGSNITVVVSSGSPTPSASPSPSPAPKKT
jgi:PASTA domain